MTFFDDLEWLVELAVVSNAIGIDVDEGVARDEWRVWAQSVIRTSSLEEYVPAHMRAEFLRRLVYPEPRMISTMCNVPVRMVRDCDPPMRLRFYRDPCVWGADHDR